MADDLPTLLARMYANGPRYDVGGNEIDRTTFVPHDPVDPALPNDPQTCNLCPGEPFGRCAQRLAQRQVIQREVIPFIKSGLYSRGDDLPTDPANGMRWTSPLRWSAFIGYGVDDAFLISSHLSDGRVWGSTLTLATADLDRLIP
jgi:hypothetical protein